MFDAASLDEVDAVPEHLRVEQRIRRQITRLHKFDALLDESRTETVLEDFRLLEDHLVRFELQPVLELSVELVDDSLLLFSL